MSKVSRGSAGASPSRITNTQTKVHEKQAENTSRRRCGRARQFFKAAIKAKLIDENPFDGVGYSSASQNLRTTFNKIVKRAGLKHWPKPFQNLRSTRETELMEIYPSHVVVSWIGHSEKVARKHYLQTTDAHFEKAVQSDSGGAQGNRQGHTTCEMVKTDEPIKQENPAKHSVLRGSSDDFAINSYPAGTRTPTVSARN